MSSKILNPHNFDGKELEQLEMIDSQIKNINLWIKRHVSELRRLMEEEDWLSIYATSILKFNLDFRFAISKFAIRKIHKDSKDPMMDLMSKNGFGPDTTVEQVAEYAHFIWGFLNARRKAAE